MNKHWEKEAWRIEHEADARITFTIALHGKHAWEMLLEDSDRYHSIGHGWATDNPHEWEAAIAAGASWTLHRWSFGVCDKGFRL